MSASADAASLVEAAPAKINLYLHVVGRRADGYHLLESLVAFAGTGDRLHVAAARELSLSIDGPFAPALAGEPDNLVLKAARALSQGGQGAALALTKNLPVASGIGGGSADAAAALRALRRLWGSDLNETTLLDVARKLGADVPVCLFGRPAFISGAGETVVPAPALPRLGLVLANPGVKLATAEIFAIRTGPHSSSMGPARLPADPAGLIAALAACRNDLTEAAIRLVPAVGEVIRALAASPGCRLARMSGSGATCFGLYDDEQAAKTAAAWLVERQRGWWIDATVLAAA